MNRLPEPLKRLTEELSKLPSIGPRAALRLSFYLSGQEKEEIDRLANAVRRIKEIKVCSTCFNISDQDPCPICADPHRDKSLICAVENALVLLNIEKTNVYNGTYHVLGGSISPASKAHQKEVNALLKRLRGPTPKVQEVIIATNPTTEGETTALYLEKLIKPLGIKTSRLGRGLPKGGDIEYADEETLKSSLNGRK